VSAADHRRRPVRHVPDTLPPTAASRTAAIPDVLGNTLDSPAGNSGNPATHPAGRPAGGAAGSAAATAFGRVITSMVTPFDEAGRVDEFAAEQLAGRLTRDGWNDAVLVNGSTGESGATDDAEKRRMILRARRAVSGTVRKVIAGIGSGNTAHSVRLAVAAQGAGADGLLVAAPYYSRPSQSGLLEHFRAVADATTLPVMLYDDPERIGVAIEPDTLREAALHPRILAVKDAKGHLGAASSVMRTTGLAYYSGDDVLNLPWLAVGATGFVSVAGHVVGDRLQSLLRLHDEGRNAEALALHHQLLPICAGLLRAPSAASAKAALRALGLPAGSVRLPLVDLTEDQYREIRNDLVATVTELGFSTGPGADKDSRPARPTPRERVHN
jgi:4-hydroxy-tetrahydrodipicolinate synthase